MTYTELKKQASKYRINIEKLGQEYFHDYEVTDTTDKGGMWACTKTQLEELVTGLIAKQVFLRAGK